MMTLEPTLKETKIKPTMKKKEVCKVKTESIERITFEDMMAKMSISAKTLVSILDNYFSADELNDIFEYVKDECGYDEEILTENGIDLDTDTLLSKVDDNELKTLVKDAGVNLKGSESKDELVGMAKVLASTNESTQKAIAKMSALKESTKLKRKKGIPHKKSKFLK